MNDLVVESRKLADEVQAMFGPGANLKVMEMVVMLRALTDQIEADAKLGAAVRDMRWNHGLVKMTSQEWYYWDMLELSNGKVAYKGEGPTPETALGLK